CDGIASFTCKCKNGFNGKFCKNNIDDCKRVRCLNGGTCKDGIASFNCQCKPGFSGKFCQVPSCHPNPCQNGGKCLKHGNAIKCWCKQGYEGRFCETGVKECNYHCSSQRGWCRIMGTDGRIYDNYCQFERAQCKNKSLRIKKKLCGYW
uniref:EGF-like domain-containing protein n=2 Tax=Clytia hemisphaerica TaxID=252671 RepID=A0A7M5XQ89_9CNID